jgi:hypothetical protein
MYAVVEITGKKGTLGCGNQLWTGSLTSCERYVQCSGYLRSEVRILRLIGPSERHRTRRD